MRITILILSIMVLLTTSGCFKKTEIMDEGPGWDIRIGPAEYTFSDYLHDFNFSYYNQSLPSGSNVYYSVYNLSYNYGFRLVNTPTHDMARDYLAERMREIGLDVKIQEVGDTSYRNILGFKWGKDRNRCIVLGAHYDTINTVHGANDNGGGCCAVLEIARAISNYNLTKTIIFALWDAEEIGFRGSIYFASNYKELNISISAYLNFDCIGVNYPCKDIVHGNTLMFNVGLLQGNINTDFNQLVRFVASNIIQIPSNLSGFPEASRGSDQQSFFTICPVAEFKSDVNSTGWYTSFCNTPLDTFPTYEASAGGAEELKKGLDTTVRFGYYVTVVWANYYSEYEED